MDSRLRELTDINSHDILDALGLGRIGPARRALEMAFRRPARLFAEQVLAFDDEVKSVGIHTAARRLVSKYTDALVIHGAEGIPARGPVLILSNHPGMTDTVCLFAAIDRPDLRILAADRPFLRALRATSRSLLFIPEEPGHRMGAIRAAVAHLRSGGALLTFPAGRIEPDPAVLPGAVESVSRWSSSTALFLRAAPGTRVVPVIVSGVLSGQAQRNPLTRLRRAREDREKLAAMLQIMARTLSPRALPVRVRVEVLEPFDGDSLPRHDTLGPIRNRVVDSLRGRGPA